MENILKYENENREVNKEARKEKQGQKVNCECGCIVSKSNMARHLKTPTNLDFFKLSFALVVNVPANVTAGNCNLILAFFLESNSALTNSIVFLLSPFRILSK